MDFLYNIENRNCLVFYLLGCTSTPCNSHIPIKDEERLSVTGLVQQVVHEVMLLRAETEEDLALLYILEESYSIFLFLWKEEGAIHVVKQDWPLHAAELFFYLQFYLHSSCNDVSKKVHMRNDLLPHESVTKPPAVYLLPWKKGFLERIHIHPTMTRSSATHRKSFHSLMLLSVQPFPSWKNGPPWNQGPSNGSIYCTAQQLPDFPSKTLIIQLQEI